MTWKHMLGASPPDRCLLGGYDAKGNWREVIAEWKVEKTSGDDRPDWYVGIHPLTQFGVRFTMYHDLPEKPDEPS